jgi:hypothetical protein
VNTLRRHFLTLAALAVGLFGAMPAEACSACFGKSNDKMLTAYYIGAAVLVGMISAVLGGITMFFVYLARRSARTAAEDRAANSTSPTI